ncbi:hypothetical protein [Janthinobacterium sp. HLX7-2]|uniref:hypothetical protein n=1 Tax=Janthinobacterium sp. HLX7-2 TaxID=1259331 RepID=UPI003F228890
MPRLIANAVGIEAIRPAAGQVRDIKRSGRGSHGRTQQQSCKHKISKMAKRKENVILDGNADVRRCNVACSYMRFCLTLTALHGTSRELQCV